MQECEFFIAEHVLDGAHVIEIRGEVDLATVPQFHERLDDVLHRGKNRIVIDCAGVTFMDSSMVHAIVSTVGRLRRGDGDLAIVCNHPRVCRIFEILGFDGLVAIRPSRDEAVASLSA